MHDAANERTVRALTVADAAEVATLWMTCTAEVARVAPIYTPDITAEALARLLEDELASGARRGWCVTENDDIVAYVTCRIEDESPLFRPRRYVHVIDLDVAPSHRGAGLSRRLMAEVEAFARASGIRRIELAYAAADPRAGAVWERLGFRPHFVHAHLDLEA